MQVILMGTGPGRPSATRLKPVPVLRVSTGLLNRASSPFCPTRSRQKTRPCRHVCKQDPAHVIIHSSLSPFSLVVRALVALSSKHHQPLFALEQKSTPPPFSKRPLLSSLSSTYIPPLQSPTLPSSTARQPPLHPLVSPSPPQFTIVQKPLPPPFTKRLPQPPRVSPRHTVPLRAATTTSAAAPALTTSSLSQSYLSMATRAAAAATRPTSTASAAVTTTSRKPCALFSPPRRRLRPARETSVLDDTPPHSDKNTAPLQAADTEPRLTGDGQYLMFPGDVRNAHALGKSAVTASQQQQPQPLALMAKHLCHFHLHLCHWSRVFNLFTYR
jgi:hypothetical protein